MDTQVKRYTYPERIDVRDLDRMSGIVNDLYGTEEVFELFGSVFVAHIRGELAGFVSTKYSRSQNRTVITLTKVAVLKSVCPEGLLSDKAASIVDEILKEIIRKEHTKYYTTVIKAEVKPEHTQLITLLEKLGLRVNHTELDMVLEPHEVSD